MSWRLSFSVQAQKDLRRLSAETARHVVTVLERVAATEHGDLKMLKGQGGLLRLRVGDWRVVLRLIRGNLEVIRILHRSVAYRE